MQLPYFYPFSSCIQLHLRRLYKTASVTTLTLCCNPTSTVFTLTRLHHSVQLSCSLLVTDQAVKIVKKDFLELVPLMSPSLLSSFVNELHCIEKHRVGMDIQTNDHRQLRPVTFDVQCSRTRLDVASAYGWNPSGVKSIINGLQTDLSNNHIHIFLLHTVTIQDCSVITQTCINYKTCRTRSTHSKRYNVYITDTYSIRGCWFHWTNRILAVDQTL